MDAPHPHKRGMSSLAVLFAVFAALGSAMAVVIARSLQIVSSPSLKVIESTIPEQRIPVDTQAVFPLVLSPAEDGSSHKSDDLVKWMVSNRDKVDELLARHKCILFRGFNLQDAHAFNDFVEATGLAAMEYVGGAAVRKVITNRVLTANESPASEIIPFHVTYLHHTI